MLRMGESSILAEPRSHISLGASGRLGNRSVEVIGRVRYDYGRGQWDEWFIEDERGGFGWLVEDEKEFTLESPIPKLPAGIHADLKAGEVLGHADSQWEVREVGVGRCVGVEGQVRRAARVGEMVRFIDLAEVGGGLRMSVEFTEDGRGEAFVGRVLRPEQVRLSGVAAPPSAGVAAQTIRLSLIHI